MLLGVLVGPVPELLAQRGRVRQFDQRIFTCRYSKSRLKPSCRTDAPSMCCGWMLRRSVLLQPRHRLCLLFDSAGCSVGGLPSHWPAPMSRHTPNAVPIWHCREKRLSPPPSPTQVGRHCRGQSDLLLTKTEKISRLGIKTMSKSCNQRGHGAWVKFPADTKFACSVVLRCSKSATPLSSGPCVVLPLFFIILLAP